MHTDGPSLRELRVNILDLEWAFETPPEQFRHFLDRETGEVLMLPGYGYDGDVTEEMEAAAEAIDEEPARYVALEAAEDLRPSLHEAREFALTVQDPRLQRQLVAALDRRRGAFRQFLDTLRSEVGEWERWHAYAHDLLRERIIEFLRERGIALRFDEPPAFREPAARDHLIEGLQEFVARAQKIRGVRRIALIGSMATTKAEPNDVDVLVTIDSAADARGVAKAARKLAGHAQQRNRGADVFLATADGRYLGRICLYKKCGPGLHAACRAEHCGDWIQDDLKQITIAKPLIENPPVELWPAWRARGETPEDLATIFGQDS